MTRVVWGAYSTGTVHAYPPDSTGRTVCGHPYVPRKLLPYADGGRICQACLHWLGFRGPRYVRHEPDAVVCACDGCRGGRFRGLREYLRDVNAAIRKTADQHVRNWPGAVELVGPAEAAFGAMLLMWEMDGVERELRIAEIHDAERGLLLAWRKAADAYAGRTP